jgi:hypothetical protein
MKNLSAAIPLVVVVVIPVVAMAARGMYTHICSK